MKGLPAPPPRHSTLLAALSDAAASPHGVTFVGLHEEEERHSWASVENEAKAFAGGLRERGISPGDRVGLLLRTGPRFFRAFYGVLHAGAIPVPLYPPVRLGRLEEYHRATSAMLRRVDTALVVSEPPLSHLLGPTLEAARPRFGLALVDAVRAELAQWQVKEDDLALIQFSSGSTVDPKPVCLTHRQLQAHVAALQLVVEARDGDTCVSWLPLYHDMGLIGAVFSTVDYPGSLVLIPPENFLAKPGLWLRTLSRHSGTVSGAPNFAYGLCLKRITDAELAGVDLSSWRLAFNGAESVSAKVARAFSERFARHGFRPEAMRPVYGLSEATLAVTFPPRRAAFRSAVVSGRELAEQKVFRPTHDAPVDASGNTPDRRELVSVGSPIPGVEVEIRSEQGSVLPEGHVGQVFARGPSMMRGYFGDAFATARALPDGWLDTGDLGLESEGELFLVGRAKEIVILRGANHPPRAFEECLDEVSGIRAGCAVALGFVPAEADAAGSDEAGSDNEELLILAEEAARMDGEARAQLATKIRDAILARTGIRPHTVEVLPQGTLPRTSSGKLRRTEALRLYLAGELQPPEPVNRWRIAKAMAKSAAAYTRLRFERGMR